MKEMIHWFNTCSTSTKLLLFSLRLRQITQLDGSPVVENVESELIPEKSRKIRDLDFGVSLGWVRWQG